MANYTVELLMHLAKGNTGAIIVLSLCLKHNPGGFYRFCDALMQKLILGDKIWGIWEKICGPYTNKRPNEIEKFITIILE